MSEIAKHRRVSRNIQAGAIWANAWAELNDGFAEGGYKQSGIGRLRGPLAITDFRKPRQSSTPSRPSMASPAPIREGE